MWQEEPIILTLRQHSYRQLITDEELWQMNTI